MKEKIDTYFNIQKEIYDYFGYIEEWAVIPFDDRRDMYWKIQGLEVIFHEVEDIVKSENGEYYSDELYHLYKPEQSIFRKEDFTLIKVDTHTDGNKFLAIYDNLKEVK